MLACCGCNNIQNTKTSKVMQSHKPEAVVKDIDYCIKAEQHLKDLKCISATEPYTKKGLSFTQFCNEIQKSGVFINPKCLSEIKKCDEQDACLQVAP
jgi:hypothetical protein